MPTSDTKTATHAIQAKQIIHDPTYARRLAANIAVHAIKHASGEYLSQLMTISKALADYANILDEHQ